MKAIVLNETGGPKMLKMENRAIPKPSAGEVVIKLQYAALNRRDLFITYGLYPSMNLPSILGSDGAGVVVEVGSGVTSVQNGQEVVINPGLNWGENDRFANADFRILGMPTNGTYAQYVVVRGENVFPKPKHLRFEEAAALPLAGVTAYRALFTRGELKEGETVLIPGIGSGVALYLLQMAVAAGANVFVTSSSEEKIEQAKNLGAKGGINYRNERWAKELKKTMGLADLIVDGVGGPGFNDLINVTAPGGRIVSFGATNGPVPECVMPKIFFKNMDIRGTTMGSPRDFQQMLSFYEQHELHPIIDRCYTLEEAKEALHYMEEGKNFGKITLKIEY
ncbi:zinc-binding dehydrogenase [Bacillus sp. FJAT-47783]|uniref:quinone oxidoreductase family protein n=1 Tax=Bacillus sp. FJAT-47783 TaxID=2922712 RepID=UPI001FABC4BE|nr:zinc-binding dehydrogenase [Bacillus sp. FJAT-47783]